MKFFVGYMFGGVLVATSILYILNKRGVINVWMYWNYVNSVNRSDTWVNRFIFNF